MFNTLKNYIDNYINRILPTYAIERDSLNLSYKHYDIMFGVSNYLNILLEIGLHADSKIIEKKILNYLIPLTKIHSETWTLGLIPNRNIEDIQNNNIFKNGYYNMGVAHGLLGIYYIFLKYSKTRDSPYLNEHIHQLEVFLTTLFYSKNSYNINGILLPNSITSLENPPENYSWCYGLSGYMSLLYSQSINQSSIFWNRKQKISDFFKKSCSHLLKENNNKIFQSATFCHGIPGLIYELFLIQTNNEDEFNYIISMLLKKLDTVKRKNKLIFEDYVTSNISPYNFLSGNIGTMLVINSILTNTRFIGDFLLAKL